MDGSIKGRNYNVVICPGMGIDCNCLVGSGKAVIARNEIAAREVLPTECTVLEWRTCKQRSLVDSRMVANKEATHGKRNPSIDTRDRG